MIYNPTETPVRIKKKKRIKIGKEFHILKQLNNIVGHIELCSEKKKKILWKFNGGHIWSYFCMDYMATVTEWLTEIW